MKTPRGMFITVATLLRPAQAQDQGGSVVLDFEAAGDFRCRTRLLSAAESRTVHGNDTTYGARLYCGPEVDITEKDRVQIGTRTYKIHSVDDPNRMGAYKVVELVDSL